MNKEWLIINREHSVSADCEQIVGTGGFVFYASKSEVTSFTLSASEGEGNRPEGSLPGKKGDTYSLLIDGYILPRQEYFEKYGHMDQYELVETLYRENGPGFTDFIKGNFIIIIVCPEVGFYIFTDRIGMKKVFYYFEEKSGEYILSNRFKLVADAVESEPDYTNIAIEVLTHHFIDGLTYLKGIRYSKPASRIRFDGKLNFEHYWDCTELLKLEIEEITPDRLAGEFRGILKSCIDYLKPGKVAVTITGGLDSRTILAALLNLGVKPYTFSYGHPQSPDVVCGRKLAAACDLEYHNHYVQPTADWFGGLAEEILDKGNTITHLHRAHRLDAFKMEVGMHPGVEMMVGGYMGGESIRNFFYDNLIVSEFVKAWIHGDGDKRALIKETLAKKFIKESEVDIEEIYNYLNGQRFLSKSDAGCDYSRAKMSEFFMTFSLLAGTHHSQDPNLLSHFIKYPVQVYLDIDFLTLVFGSKYNFLYEGEKGESKSGYMKRVKGAELYCHFVDTFSPELAAVPFSKRGYYSAREYVGDSMLVLLLKRAKRYWFNRTKGPVNFTLGRWMADYVNKEFTNIDTHADVAKLFDIEKVKNSLSTNVHQSKEQYWRKYTDIIWMHRLIKK